MHARDFELFTPGLLIQLSNAVFFLSAIPNSPMPPNCVLSANIISSFLFFFVPEENYLKLAPSNFTHYVPLVL